MMCSDTAELPTAECVGFWTGKDGQIQGRQSHHKIQKPYIGGGCENPHTLGLICSSSCICNCPLPGGSHCTTQDSQLLQLLIWSIDTEL